MYIVLYIYATRYLDYVDIIAETVMFQLKPLDIKSDIRGVYLYGAYVSAGRK